MNTKSRLLSLLLLLSILLSAGAATARAESNAVATAERLCDGILAYKERQSGTSSVQELIDTGLSAAAGETAEFYVIALSQYGGYDFSLYESALLGYIHRNEVYSATTREKYALALVASGSTDSIIGTYLNNSVGQQGLMSYVFGLHLMNNGYRCDSYTVSSLIDTILSMQLSDGGWAVIGQRGDVDVTAMALQSLAPYYAEHTGVRNSVDRAVALLSSLQNADGGYTGMGQANCESTAQVLCALSCLQIDQNIDSRFVKNGSTVLDALAQYQNADGSFSHTHEGYNESATVQSFYALVAYLRMCRGQSGLYLLDRRNPSGMLSPDDTDVSGSQPSANASMNSETRVIQTPYGDYIEIIYEDGSRETVAVSDSNGTDITAPTQFYGGELQNNSGSGAVRALQSATPDEGGDNSGTYRYKPAVILAILLAGAAGCVILYIRRKRNIKHYIAIAAITAALIAFVLLTNFSSAESYYSGAHTATGSDSGTVTMSIRCDTILSDDDLPSYIPDDGVILPATEFAISDSDTVYDILIDAARTYGIRLDADGSHYIRGIDYLYEYDFGELSGWMYRVNGELPNRSCGSYTVEPDDVIEWLYTTDIGNDL